jgi:hypothetical protein
MGGHASTPNEEDDMKQVRRADERGDTNIGWLESKHTFSFGGYYDPRHMNFRALRVINDDRVAPGQGFGTHPHSDMEIISYVVDGALEHKDSMGTGSVIRPGEIQIMSAGTGVTHSEYNGSKEDPVRFLQIWLPPAERGLKPRYQQREFPVEERRGALRLLISPDGDEGSLEIRRDVRIYGGYFAQGESDTLAIGRGRSAWVQVVKGSVEVDGEALTEGDGVGIMDPGEVTIAGKTADGEVIVFDLD